MKFKFVHMTCIASVLCLLCIGKPVKANTPAFKKITIIVFENENQDPTLKQPFFKKMASDGVLLENMHAETHPSQGNYFAMIAGSVFNMSGPNGDDIIDLDARHLGDLLEDKGHTWKAYNEGYIGNCFQGKRNGSYVRKHNPFISFKNIQNDSARCAANIVNGDEFFDDIESGKLPDVSFYVPDLNNDGHDTNVAFADKYFSRKFGPILKDPKFVQDMLFVVTFDESQVSAPNNLIYTVLWGDAVRSGTTSPQRLDHYSILKLIEDTFGLANLGQKDVTASAITGIWK
jgi:hypothetical protein